MPRRKPLQPTSPDAATPAAYTMNGVAEQLGVSRETVRRMIARGELRAYKVGPKLVRIDPADVAKVMRPIGTPRTRSAAAPVGGARG